MELVEAVVRVESVDEFVERLGAVGDEHGVTVQAFDVRYIADHGHLERAVALADRAIDRGENVARDRAVEILCYAAGRRQIERSLELGVSAGECPAVVLVDDPTDEGESEGGTAAERAAVETVESMHAFDLRPTLGEYDVERVREFFDVSEAELATVDGDLAALVHERVALLDVEK